MIEKNNNIHKHHQLKRIVEHKGEQINFLDQRFYKTDTGEYYPSVTSILNYYPKNSFFYTWLKDVGHNSDILVKKASDEGTQVHNAIESFLQGEEIKWINNDGHANYNLDVWKMILKFFEFWNEFKPELVAKETHLLSHEHRYAGTCDLVIKLNNKLWLLDIKTSNSLHTSYYLQLAAYVKAWNETHEQKIEEAGVIWLKSSKRSLKEGKLQGNGWEIIQGNKTIDEYFNMFKNIYEIYITENPDQKPLFESYPTSIKLS
jgi:hypothetical protein